MDRMSEGGPGRVVLVLAYAENRNRAKKIKDMWASMSRILII